MILACSAILGACTKSTSSSESITAALSKPTNATVVSPPSPRSDTWCTTLLESRPKGVSIVALFNRIKAIAKEKSEFETEDGYQERLHKLIDAQKAYLSQTTGSKYAAIVAPLPIVNQKYDAERGVLHIGAEPLDGGFFKSSVGFETDNLKKLDFKLVPIQVINDMKGSYIGANAYGATRRVDEIASDEYGIALSGRYSSRLSYLSASRGIDLPLSATRAAAFKGKIGLLIIGDLVIPGIVEARKDFSATFSNPGQVDVRKKYVAIQGSCAAVISLDTRETLLLLD